MEPSCPRSRHLFRVPALVFILITMLAGCQRTTEQDLIGRWQVDYSASTLSLNLNQDGTFEQIFQMKDDPSLVRRTGEWELKDLEGDTVILHGALIIDDATGRIDAELSAKSDEAWLLRVDKTLGYFRLPVNEDLHLYFEKRNR